MKGIINVLLAAALAVPVPALAAPADLEEARKLHVRAQAQFDTADYEGAIESWTAALEALPDDPCSARLRPLIQYNVATAHERAYEISNDVSNLRRAKAVLEGFARAVPSVYPDADEAAAELERVEARIQGIDEKIAAHVEPEAEPEPEPELESRTAPEVEPGTESEVDRGRPLVITGAVLTGVGAAFGGMAIAGAVIGSNANDIGDDVTDDFDARGEQFERGRAGNALLVVGAVVAPVFVGAGVALLVVGKRRSKGGSSARIAPTMSRSSLGLVVSGRF